MDGVAHLRREGALHALMLGVMAAAMVSHSVVVSMIGAAVLVVASVPCAALSRSRVYFRAPILDLWAMALVLLALLPQPAVQGQHHVMVVQSGWAFAAIVTAWAGARLWVGMRGSGMRAAAAVASGGVTGAGLVAMAVLCGA